MQEGNSKLTKRQKQVYDFVSSQYKKNGFAPTLKEIGNEFSFGTSSAQSFVRVLSDKGYLTKVSNSARSIIPKKETVQNMSVSLRILGVISAGYGIQVDESSEPELVEVPASMARNTRDYYCLKVSGWSMRDSDIADEDIIIVHHQAVANNGEIVVAILKGDFEEKATLKKFYHRGNLIELIPQNPTFKKIVAQPGEVEIRGKFCGLLRKPTLNTTITLPL